MTLVLEHRRPTRAPTLGRRWPRRFFSVRGDDACRDHTPALRLTMRMEAADRWAARLRAASRDLVRIGRGGALPIAIAIVAAAAPARADDGLDLARAAVHEAGLEATVDEVAALWAVATRVPRQAPMRVQMRRFFAARTDRPHLLMLARNMRNRPWPHRQVPYRWRATWRELLEVADRVVAGEIVHRCEEPPQAWGGVVDRERARRAGLVEIDCGDTVNDFYRRRSP